MTFETLFALYYTLYRGDSSVPATTDPEWTMAIRFYNDALYRMAAMDDTKWNFMWSTFQTDSPNAALVSGTTTYDAPDDMAEPGGQLTYIDTTGNRINYPVVEPYEAQGLGKLQTYGYFTGDQQNGFVLHVNPSPDSNAAGHLIDYVYYRKPLELDDAAETGTSLIEGGDPAYYYNHMLAQRYRIAENWPAYQTALRDSEEALKSMKLKNNSGNFYSPWTLQDSTTTRWGQ